MVVKFNSQQKIVAVLAVRAGSQRVPEKNIRKFHDTNLLELKLNVLTRCKQIDEIVVNSDSEEMLEIGRKFNVSTHKREDYFASSKASNSEFHGHIAEMTEGDVIFLAPACSPFISSARHDEIIEHFKSGEFDSLTSTHLIKGHLWLDNKPLNYDLGDVPNSQDLPDIEMLNYGVSLINREIMLKNKALVGDNPGFINLNSIESIDINTLEEFELAEIIYKEGLVEKLF
ncbi:MAG: hypothetical protein CBC04_00655 [Verrucomicrobia bacterium TMED44]|nr:MAG: hypothetical protein CBC04_00655 [Verrucomicrobia bacterium TMED44]